MQYYYKLNIDYYIYYIIYWANYVYIFIFIRVWRFSKPQK